MKRLALALILALLATAATAGPISKAKTMQFEPDLEAIVICDSKPCGLDAECAWVMEVDDVRQVRMRTVDRLRPVLLIAGGPLADKFQAIGFPGQVVKVNGRGGDEFKARELIAPTGDIEQDLAGWAMRYAAKMCDQPFPGGKAVARPVEAVSVVDDMDIPEPITVQGCGDWEALAASCRGALTMALVGYESVLGKEECRTPAAIRGSAAAANHLDEAVVP